MATLLQSDAQALHQICDALYKELIRDHPFTPETPGLLCHYTTGTGLKGILESHEIWATNIAYLNDASEYRHISTGMLWGIRERQPKFTDPLAHLFLDRLVARVNAADLVQPVWVACFSEKSDDLNQWRAYGAGEGGFAVCFDAVALFELVRKNAPADFLVPCDYNTSHHAAMIGTLIHSATQLWMNVHSRKAPSTSTTDLLNDFVEHLVWQLHYLAPMFKHQAFADEKEWRIVRHTPVGDYSQIRFQPKAQMFSGYIPIGLAGVTPKGLMPIKRVVIGPSRNTELSAVAVTAMLAKLGYAIGAKGVEVRSSEIPYRAS